MAIEVKMQKDGDKLNISLSGIIDEDVDFSNYSLSGVSQVELHLKDVKSINSCGIREWIKWISSAGEATVIYDECPKIIVDQINMVEGFLPAKGKVTSFYVPYYNDDSGEEKMVLFKQGQEFNEQGVTPPSSVKDSAGNEMEMDIMESKYFKFIKK